MKYMLLIINIQAEYENSKNAQREVVYVEL